jgi:integrase
MNTKSAKGNAVPHRGKWYARISLGVLLEGFKTTRPAICLPGITTEAEAQTRATQMAELATMLRDAGHLDTIRPTLLKAASLPAARMPNFRAIIAGLCSGGGEEHTAQKALAVTMTFQEVRKLLTTGDLHRRYPDVVEAVGDEHRKDIEKKSERYIEPHLSNVAITAFSLDHALEVMRHVPKHLSGATRRHIAQCMHRVLELSVFPLRLITSNPLPRTFMPKLGPAKARGFLFPDEDALLLQGRHKAPAEATVPLPRRVLFGFFAREGMRREEAATLEWADVHLGRGWVTLDRNKTDDPRDWPLDPGVAEALRRWRKMNPKARYVFGGDAPFPADHLADDLRDDLEAVGIDRAELFESTDVRRKINVHDLRGTFVTIALATGKTEGWISRRTGHRSSAMIAKYRRRAENLAEAKAGELRPLVEAIPELAALAPEARADPGSKLVADVAKGTGGSGPAPEIRPGMPAAARMTESHSRGRRFDPGQLHSKTAEANPSAGYATESALPEALPESPLTASVAALSTALTRAVTAGDLVTARTIQEALGRLLARASGEPGDVIPIDSARKGRNA